MYRTIDKEEQLTIISNDGTFAQRPTGKLPSALDRVCTASSSAYSYISKPEVNQINEL